MVLLYVYGLQYFLILSILLISIHFMVLNCLLCNIIKYYRIINLCNNIFGSATRPEKLYFCKLLITGIKTN